MNKLAKKDPRDLSLPGFTLTAVGLVAGNAPTFDQWVAAGYALERMEGSVQWWIGDWLNYGEGRPQWGEKYEQAISMFKREYDTISQYRAVSKAFEFRERSRNLTWSHHLAVAYEPPEVRGELLLEAEPEAPDRPPRMTVAELKKEARQRRPKAITPPLPAGKYNLIYADPPWRYEHSKTDNRKIENHYPTMELQDICALPIQSIADDDCVLFLWATSPKLAESIDVLEAWGFTYRTCMVWVKDKIGMGYYARQKHELLLICAKGEPSVPGESNRPPSVIEGTRAEHSRKPDRFYELIETMYPDATKVELFCRRPRDGWSVWGNEVSA